MQLPSFHTTMGLAVTSTQKQDTMIDTYHYPSKHFVLQEIAGSTYAMIGDDGGAAIREAAR